MARTHGLQVSHLSIINGNLGKGEFLNPHISRQIASNRMEAIDVSLGGIAGEIFYLSSHTIPGPLGLFMGYMRCRSGAEGDFMKLASLDYDLCFPNKLKAIMPIIRHLQGSLDLYNNIVNAACEHSFLSAHNLDNIVNGRPFDKIQNEGEKLSFISSELFDSLYG